MAQISHNCNSMYCVASPSAISSTQESTGPEMSHLVLYFRYVCSIDRFHASANAELECLCCVPGLCHRVREADSFFVSTQPISAMDVPIRGSVPRDTACLHAPRSSPQCLAAPRHQLGARRFSGSPGTLGRICSSQSCTRGVQIACCSAIEAAAPGGPCSDRGDRGSWLSTAVKAAACAAAAYAWCRFSMGRQALLFCSTSIAARHGTKLPPDLYVAPLRLRH